MFHMIGFVIFGFIVGLLARAFTPGPDRMSLIVTSLLGISGSLIAGWVGRALGWYGPEDGAGFIMSTVGAMLVLGVYRKVVQKRGFRDAPSVSSYRRAA